MRIGARVRIIGAAGFLALGAPAGAGEAVGPCSPYRAADGDIPSEMPGCGHRVRHPPGSLEDELAFRRGRGDADGPEDDPTPARAPRRRHR